MKFKITSQLFFAFVKTLGFLFLFLFVGLFLDSTIISSMYSGSQIFTNIFVFIGFFVLYYRSANRIRQLMVHAVLIGILGEYLFSLGLHMYAYRLGNVPMYVPPGHAIVYIATIYFCKKRIIKIYKTQVEKVFVVLILLYALLFLIFANDIFGFIMTLAVVYLLRNKPRERLFYLSMYVVVAVLEIIGTTFKCWVWPDTAFGIIPFLKSANPPSGISLVYFLLDLGSLWFYKLRNRTAWERMKRIRIIQEL